MRYSELNFKSPDQMQCFFTHLVLQYGNKPFIEIKDLNEQHAYFCKVYDDFDHNLEGILH